MNPTGESYVRALSFHITRLPAFLWWAIRAAYLRRLIASAEIDRAQLFQQMQQAPTQLRVYSAAIDVRRVQLLDAERAMRGL